MRLECPRCGYDADIEDYYEVDDEDVEDYREFNPEWYPIDDLEDWYREDDTLFEQELERYL